MLLEKINLFSKSIELKMADICDRFDLTMTNIYILMIRMLLLKRSLKLELIRKRLIVVLII